MSFPVTKAMKSATGMVMPIVEVALPSAMLTVRWSWFTSAA
jgi:hypothetical protein